MKYLICFLLVGCAATATVSDKDIAAQRKTASQVANLEIAEGKPAQQILTDRTLLEGLMSLSSPEMTERMKR